jgi:hypothetical protein
VLLAPSARSGTFPPARAYAHTLALATWHSEAQWQDLDAVVVPESHWDPCAYNPVSRDCAYAGSASCGIPQAQPCPAAWRGRLGATWRAQVRWLIAYVLRRYKLPSVALAHERAYGWY